MQSKFSMRCWAVPALAVLVLLAACGLSSDAQHEPPRHLPREIVQAWKDAGAEIGWMSVNNTGHTVFNSKKQGQHNEVPAFRFDLWKAKVLVKLPAPATAFGLSLGRTAVTDAGLKELAGLKSLQTLDLGFTQVTDAGLKELAGLKNLQSLNLWATRVTGAHLKELTGLKSLQTLDLSSTKVTDAGLKELAELKSLQTLNLGGIPMTDAGVKNLTELKSLRTLILINTKVTDAGLKELAGLNRLRSLDLRGTQVTDAGVKKLRQALPGCQIQYSKKPVRFMSTR